MNTQVENYEQTKIALDQKQNLNASCEQKDEASSLNEIPPQIDNNDVRNDVVDHPIEELRRGIQSNNESENREPYHISLGSKAEDDIVKDAKRKKIMLNMCDQLINKQEINCSPYSIARLKGLRSLNLSSCNRISDVSLKYTFDFIELKELSLSRCQQISVIGIECLLAKCPSIEILNLSECHNLTDQAIDMITIKLIRLTHLHIERCSQLTDFSLDSIAVNCKRIKYLDLRGCRSMGIEPNLRLEHIRSLHRILISKPGPYMPSYGKHPKPPPLPSNI